jgi:hypothetical protein
VEAGSYRCEGRVDTGRRSLIRVPVSFEGVGVVVVAAAAAAAAAPMVVASHIHWVEEGCFQGRDARYPMNFGGQQFRLEVEHFPFGKY